MVSVCVCGGVLVHLLEGDQVPQTLDTPTEGRREVERKGADEKRWKERNGAEVSGRE